MKAFRMPTYSKQMARELYEFYNLMLESVIQNYINQVLNKLAKTTIKEFEFKDANYATTIKRLANALSVKVFERFNNKRVKKTIRKAYESAEKINKNIFIAKYADALGVDTKSIINDINKDDIEELITTAIDETKNNRDSYIRELTLRSLEIANRGGGYKELLQATKKFKQTAQKHMQRLTNDQVANFTTTLSGLRAQSLGIKYARWRTSKDKVVRPSHRDRDGKYYLINKGLYSKLDKKTLRPGYDYNCRCWEEYIIDEQSIPNNILKELQRAA